MRTRISDRNILPNFDLEAEYNKLHSLFFDNSAFGTYTSGGLLKSRPNTSYDSALQAFFLHWHLRGIGACHLCKAKRNTTGQKPTGKKKKWKRSSIFDSIKDQVNNYKYDIEELDKK